MALYPWNEGYTHLRNAERTTDLPQRKNYLRYWEKVTGRTARKCIVFGCGTKTDLVGAHVACLGYDDDANLFAEYFLVPMCRSHNSSHVDFSRFKKDVLFIHVSDVQRHEMEMRGSGITLSNGINLVGMEELMED